MDQNIVDRIKDIIAVRNIIAHRYVKLSMEELAEVVENINVVERFIEQVLGKIEEKKKEEP